MPALIELTDITKEYQMGSVKVTAVDGVSLRIDEGEFVAIMGASGSGKSTLLSIIGFLDRPTAGIYRFMGSDITGLSDDDLSAIRNRVAGFVFQQFYLLPRMNALENAELPLVYAGKRDMKNLAEMRLDEVGLGSRMEHYPNELSGGEQQRVAIARAVVNNPMIIMADEPTGNLDTKSEEEIIRILEEMNDEGRTIVMVTHEIELAGHAHRIIRMRDGKIISDEKKKKTRATGRLQHGLKTGMIEQISETAPARAELADYIKQAFRTIVSNKLRSFLSMLGILIGVAAVVAMMAIGEGAKESIEQKLSSLGTNVLMVMPGVHKQGGVSLQTGDVTRFTFEDAAAISRLNEVNRIAPSVYGRAQLVYLNKNWNTQVQGTTVEYQFIKSAQPAMGRFFDNKDLKTRKQVAVIGYTIVKELFGDVYPVGKIIKINKKNYTVIGVLPVKGATFMKDQDDIVVVPITTAMHRLLGKDYIDIFDVEIKDLSRVQAAINAIKGILNKQHRYNETDSDKFQIRDMSQIREAMIGTTRTVSLLLGIVASISLFVGGIGIMNIMLVSVRERIKEIGLRKAVGAKRRDILVQFLIESVLMSLFGGIGGILVGSSISFAIAAIAEWSIDVSLSSILISTFFSSLVGLFFGLWPAVQASRLDPIVALRYE